MVDQSSQKPAWQQVLTLSRGYIVSRALFVVAELGIANHFDQAGSSVESLAKAVDCCPSKLFRLLRFLTDYDLFTQLDEQRFALTPLSTCLRDDGDNSVRAALRMVDDAWWQSAAYLGTSIKSPTDSAFELAHGKHFFDFLAADDERQKRFDKGMACISDYDNLPIAKALDFSVYNRIIDIGGGRGGQLQAIVDLYPNVNASLFDQPQVLEQAIFSGEKIAGSFFETIPENYDCYLIKGVLHDFCDDDALAILQRIKKAIPVGASLIIAEQIIPDAVGPHPNKTMDIVMMMLLNGRQRTLSEWTELLSRAQLSVKRSVNTASIFTLLECQAANNA